jgi:hypothetical protein
MAFGGRAVSVGVIARWGFEAIGRDLGLRSLLENDTGSGPALLAQYAGTFEPGLAAHWTILAAFAIGLLLATHAVLRRRTAPC